jgi:transcriptional regulator with XRE-family HTH domain
MFRASHTPPLSYLLDYLFTRDLHQVARYLGVTVATLKRWKSTDDAPRAALLALFYESRWGYSLMYTTAHNEALFARQELEGLKREKAALLLRIARLEATGDFGAANAPVLSARRI